ncbi:hypothetical protein QJS10_CPB14g01497 [Acorus calamus]|uniref:Putative zinc-finger domain-containing protein n=1 Tax=Acorus calamus TaxID=4465 RepID=A0AAV9DAP4_ACOCL|nr:hypothetical protein QJS10_CPB14g01497 [Acorus calamus]
MEKIEELRAKAMASMAAAAGNPNSNLKRKSKVASKEEGELSSSSSEAAVASTAARVEVPSTNTVHSVESADAGVSAGNKRARTLNSGNFVHAGGPTLSDTQFQIPAVRHYNKRSELKPVASKLGNIGAPNRPMSLGSNDDLVIRFSDEDSDTNSEEENMPERTSEVKVSAPPRNMSRTVTAPPAEVRQMKVMQKRVSSSHPFVSRMNSSLMGLGFSSSQKKPGFQKHDNVRKASATQDNVYVRDVSLADSKVADLRQEIAKRESELKFQNKSTMPPGKEKRSTSYGDCHVTEQDAKTAKMRGSAPHERENKYLRTGGKMADGMPQLLVPNTKSSSEPGKQMAGSLSCFEVKKPMSGSQCTEEFLPGTGNQILDKWVGKADGYASVSSGHVITRGDDGKISAPFVNNSASILPNSLKRSEEGKSGINGGGIPYPGNHSENYSTPSYCPNEVNQSTRLMQHPIGVMEKTINQLEIPSTENLNSGVSNQPDLLGWTEEYNLFPSKSLCQHASVRNAEVMSVVEIAQKTSSGMFEGPIGHAIEGNSSHFENSMNIQSLSELEELCDKELEEAQEMRHKCEFEERRALAALRKAQRDLIEANNRCTRLYKKRELISAQLRATIAENSSSLWPSRWQNDGEPGYASVRRISNTNADLPLSLTHQIHDGTHVLDHFVCISNVQSKVCDAGSNQICEHYANTENQFLCNDAAVPKESHSPSNNLNVSTSGEEELPSHNRSIRSRFIYEENDKNLEEKTLGLNDESETRSHDSLLLEASLRSTLFERLGRTRNPPSRNTGPSFEAAHSVDFTDDAGMSSKKSNMSPETASASSDERIQVGVHHQLTVAAGIDKDLHGRDESIRRPNHDNSSSQYFCTKTPIIHCVLSPFLKIVSKHALFVFNESCKGQLTGEEGQISEERVIDLGFYNIPKPNTRWNIMRYTRIENCEYLDRQFAIDPLWPICMFELRGKCNDDKCSWQHAKDYSQGNNKKISFPGNSDHQVCEPIHEKCSGASRFSLGPRHCTLSIPTYYIGSDLIEATFSLSFGSVLARTIWQYWKKEFCAFLALPFCVQRILPLDSLFLHGGANHAEDCDGWERLSFSFQNQSATMKQLKQGLADSEQSLELALNLFNQTLVPGRKKKALMVLSRALEADPTCISLWPVYLHIYYEKEKRIGKDDMFSDAVKYNEGSYELWLMFINSRACLNDRMDAYETALSVFCRRACTLDRTSKHTSACILDIFLQMIDCLCMSGNVEKALLKINSLLSSATNSKNIGHTMPSDIFPCLTTPDKCVLLVSCIYVMIYRKLPEVVLQKFEFEKDLPFDIEWPSIQLSTDVKKCALELMKTVMDTIGLRTDNVSFQKDSEISVRSGHFLAVSHVNCAARLEGFEYVTKLIPEYRKLYPSCTEIILISARLENDFVEDAGSEVFEQAVHNWPKEIRGIQAIWNQYAQHTLEGMRVSAAEKLMMRWYDSYCQGHGFLDRKSSDMEDVSQSSPEIPSSTNTQFCFHPNSKDELFGLINLSLLKLLQKDKDGARRAMDRALEIASPEDFKHCVREHAVFTLFDGFECLEDVSHRHAVRAILSYLRDVRSSAFLEPLSRTFLGNIKKPRIRQLVNNLLGPTSLDSSLMNSVLKELYGPSLLPEKMTNTRELVEFVGSLMEILPANYQLALSTCKLIIKNLDSIGAGSASVLFWASSLLVSSIFQASPVAPQYIWCEAAHLLSYLKIPNISEKFHHLAVSVYPFSLKLWQSYLVLAKTIGKDVGVLEAARERGIDLSHIL